MSVGPRLVRPAEDPAFVDPLSEAGSEAGSARPSDPAESGLPGGAEDGRGYSIRVVARLTGLSSDTLRMWERRYGFPKPRRNDTGVRVYLDEDIEKLALVSRALKAGYRAGEVVDRPADDLRALLTSSAETRLLGQAGAGAPTVDLLMECLRKDDANAVRNELRQSVAQLGPRQFIVEVASQLVERVGEEWEAGRIEIRHEHLMSETLSTQLRLLLSAYETPRTGPTVLFTALSHELHGLGLEMAALYVAVRGATPRLLGVDTPPDQIVEAAKALRVDAVGVSVSRSADPQRAAAELSWIVEALPESIELWVGGKAARELPLHHPRVHRTASWPELDSRLDMLRARLAQS